MKALNHLSLCVKQRAAGDDRDGVAFSGPAAPCPLHRGISSNSFQSPTPPLVAGK
jgi:hypothetical protein